MGDIRRISETIVQHRHFVTVADAISLLNLRVVSSNSTIVSMTPVSLDHLGGVPGIMIVTQDPKTETAPEDVAVVTRTT